MNQWFLESLILKRLDLYFYLVMGQGEMSFLIIGVSSFVHGAISIQYVTC